MPPYAELRSVPLYFHVRIVEKVVRTELTDLNTNGMNNANLITFSPTHIIREVVIFRVTTTEPCLAVSGDDGLSS